VQTFWTVSFPGAGFLVHRSMWRATRVGGPARAAKNGSPVSWEALTRSRQSRAPLSCRRVHRSGASAAASALANQLQAYLDIMKSYQSPSDRRGTPRDVRHDRSDHGRVADLADRRARVLAVGAHYQIVGAYSNRGVLDEDLFALHDTAPRIWTLLKRWPTSCASERPPDLDRLRIPRLPLEGDHLVRDFSLVPTRVRQGAQVGAYSRWRHRAEG